MKKVLSAGILGLLLVACGSHSKEGEQAMPKLLDYYFNQQIGGTEEAGINETYYFKLEDNAVVLEQIKVKEEQVEMSTSDGLTYMATTSLKSAEASDPSKYRKVELYGRLRDGDALLHWVMDSVPMREQIFMPSAKPQDN